MRAHALDASVRGVEFHPEAEAELISAAKYFESHVEHLGLGFISAVRRTYERILEFPHSGRPFQCLTAASGAGPTRAERVGPPPVSNAAGKIVGRPVLGGLHHVYEQAV